MGDVGHSRAARNAVGRNKGCTFLVGINENIAQEQGSTQAGGGCRAAAPPKTPQNRNLKSTDFVDIIISKVLRDFPFSRNQPLTSADDSTLEF